MARNLAVGTSLPLEKLKYNVEADDDVENTTEEADHDLPHISLWAIQDATNNFSEANKLGEGGFGPVYKARLKGVHTYEFMHNKSLDYFLKGVSFICIRILGSMVHRDLKAGNVLLDEQMNPKISDFGMARTFTGVHGQATTSTVVGTYFGILLLEIICGQLNLEFQLSHPDQNLIVHFSTLGSSQRIVPASDHEKATFSMVGTVSIYASSGFSAQRRPSGSKTFCWMSR
ncbi:hypothetical protein EJ110_NYTH00260 [Nymphaea thermarum]|nr:hypothetical protein EJ110_NYTH00260 [Nymphaea thermarum]